MKTRALLASFVLGLVAAAGINLAAPDYIAAVSKSVQASSSSSALEPVLSFLRFISTIFRDSATSPLVMPPLSSVVQASWKRQLYSDL